MYGASVRTRTGDLRITSALLYQLSYAGLSLERTTASALLYQLSYAGLSLERTTGFEPATLSLGS